MTFLLSMPGGMEWLFILIPFVLIGVSSIFYFLTLQSTLKSVSPENRKMTPEKVWLTLIPFFGVVWHFIVVLNISDSLSAEAKKRNIELAQSRPGFNIGIAMSILNCMAFIPGISIPAVIAAMVCWIIYWVKIAGYKNTLTAGHLNGLANG